MKLKYFGTDGFRGKANSTLTVEHALKIGQYLGWYFGEKNGGTARCVIGKDTRRSSYMLEYGLSAGLTSSGADSYLLHVTTSPSVSYITKSDQFDFGIMVTASHNPYQDNGIKIFDRNGEKMTDDLLYEIEQYIDGERTIPRCQEVGICKDYFQGRNKYIGFLSSIPSESFRGYKIAIDCANGASFTVAKNVFDMLGADLTVLNASPNGKNINVKSGSTHIEVLQNYVRNNSVDIAFAFDGDADRCIMVNEKGEVVDGDGIIYIIASWLKDRGLLLNDKVAVTVMSNIGLKKALAEKGIGLTVTDVGDKYISQAINEEHLSIGGEQSGHIIINKYENTGDGILTAIILAEIMVAKKCPASSLLGNMTTFPQKLKNISVSNKDEIMAAPAVQDHIKVTNEALGDSGRLLLRKSGTEQIVRIMAEAATEEECDRIIADAERVVMSQT